MYMIYTQLVLRIVLKLYMEMNSSKSWNLRLLPRNIDLNDNFESISIYKKATDYSLYLLNAFRVQNTIKTEILID